MAENISQAQHITELDFDIQKALNDLKEIENEVQKTAERISKTDFKIGDIVNNSGDFQVAIQQYDTLLSKAKTTHSELNKLKENQNNKNANLADEWLKQEQKQQSLISKELEKQWKERVAYEDNIQKLKDDFHKKNLSYIDFEIEKREEEGKRFSEMLKNQMQERVDKEKEKNQYTEKAYTLNEKLYSLAQKGKNLSDKGYVGEQKKVKQLQEQSDELLRQIKLSGTLTDEQKQQLDILSKQLREQENIYKKAASTQEENKPSSFLEKAGNYIQYKAVDMGVTAVRQGFNEVKDVETRMMEIARVMGLTSEKTTEMRGNLYSLAKEYGRSFEEVSDIALRFTQAGYGAADVMQMTKAMLLGINTAELQAESGTISLIGIMQQWGYEANDLVSIIDKLNYTADTNAITTQDLTDALLQASSVAKIAGINFNDTIGILTAMKEASGRTGKEVGNAFKSILSYMQRESSLNIFENAGIDVYVNKTTGELRPMIDILNDMAKKWGSMGDEAINALVKSADEAQLFSEEMAAVMGVQEEYEKALRDVNDAESRGVTQAAAGVFRRNYYIALMENFAKVSKVSAEAIETEGYSLRENGRYMETLEAKIQQLTASLSELAVSFADAGALDIAKNLLDGAKAITEFVQSAGGLENVLVTLSGILLILKGQEIAKGITEIGTAAKAAFNAIATGAVTAETALGPLGLALIALSATIAAVSYASKAGERAIDDMVKKGEEYNSTKGKLEEINAELEAVAKSVQEIQSKGELELTDEVQLEKLRQQTVELEKQKEYYEYIEKQHKKEYADSVIKAYSKNEGKNLDFATNLNGDVVSVSDRDVTMFNYYKTEQNKAISQGNLDIANSYDDLITELQSKMATSAINISEYMTALEEAGMQGSEIYKQMAEQKKLLDDALSGKLPTPVINSYDDYVKAVANGQIEIQNHTKATDDNTKSVNENANAIENQANAIQITSDNLSEYSTRISTLNGYIKKLSSEEKLTADEALKLIDLYPELSRQIVATSDGFYIETEALNNLNKAQIDAVVQYRIAQKELTEILSENTLQRLSAYESEILAIKTVGDLQNAIKIVESGENPEGYTVNSEYDAKRLKYWKDTVAQASEEFKPIKDLFESLYGNVSGADNTNNSLKDTKSILDTILADFNELNGRGLLDITEQIEYLNYVLQDTRLTTEDVTTVQNQLYGLYKQQINDLIKAEEEASKARQDAIKDRYNKEIEYAKESNKAQIEATKAKYNAEIDALKAYKNELSQDRKEEDYYDRRNELLKERNYYEQRTGREAVEKIEDIDKQIADLDKNYQRSLEDAEIEAQIALLQNKRDNEVAYQEELQNQKIAALQQELEAEIAKEQQKYEKFKAQFTEANIEMIASAGIYDNQLYQQFVKYFSNPMLQDLTTLLGLFAQLAAMKEQVIGGSDLSGKITISSGNTTPKIVQAATGGYTLGDGMMFLHKNEFIANADLTSKLDKFLNQYSSVGYAVNPFYLQNPLSNAVNAGNTYSNNNNSRNITIEKGAIEVYNRIEDSADAKTSADKVTREIMNNISRML